LIEWHIDEIALPEMKESYTPRRVSVISFNRNCVSKQTPPYWIAELWW